MPDITDVLRAVEKLDGKVDKLRDNFSEFKDTCHDRQSNCRTQVHGRINQIEKDVAREAGRHNGLPSKPKTREQDTVPGFLKLNWKWILLMLLIGAVLHDQIQTLIKSF